VNDVGLQVNVCGVFWRVMLIYGNKIFVLCVLVSML